MRLPTPTLFWRTFLLILLLIVASLLAWLQSFRAFEREPRAQQIAQQVVSIVNLTRNALLYSDPSIRRDLLADLADDEGIRVVPLEAGDKTEAFADVPIVRLASEKIRARLGANTRIAAAVNGMDGVWVSFDIEGDAYWVYIDRDPLARNVGTQWLGWAITAALLSLLAAIAITSVVNRPLKQLSRAAQVLGAGGTPAALPERGPAEIRTVNESFNRMVSDLAKIEQDRAVLLAGISHDLRTPLTRLRLELDINPLPAEARAAMIGDLEQMDAIVGQFLDYARPAPQQPAERTDLSALLEAALTRSRIADEAGVSLQVDVAPHVTVVGHRTELQRALANLLSNASRYGRSGEDRSLSLRVALVIERGNAVLTVADRGPGVPAEAFERMLRPFERGEVARTGGAGAGLGLAIVERIARQHGGEFRLAANTPGLRAELRLPLAA